MNKIDRLAELVRTKVTAEFLANEMVGIVNDLLAGNVPLTAPVTLSWTVGDVLGVRGFYLIDDILSELLSCYIARLVRIAAIQSGINLSAPSTLQKIAPILLSTAAAEEVAVVLAIERMKFEIGIPAEIDTAKAHELAAIRDAAHYRFMNPQRV